MYPVQAETLLPEGKGVQLTTPAPFICLWITKTINLPSPLLSCHWYINVYMLVTRVRDLSLARGSCQSSTTAWSRFVWRNLSLGVETWLWRSLSFSHDCNPSAGLEAASRTAPVCNHSSEPIFLISLLSLPPRLTPRGTFCWRLWRSTTRWGQMRLQPPWARSTTLLLWCSTTRGFSTGRRAQQERPAASAWTGTHTWRKPGCVDAPLSSKSKSQTWPTWTPSTDGHG